MAENSLLLILKCVRQRVSRLREVFPTYEAWQPGHFNLQITEEQMRDGIRSLNQKILNTFRRMKNYLKMNIRIALLNKSLQFEFNLETKTAKVWDTKQKLGFVVYGGRRLRREGFIKKGSNNRIYKKCKTAVRKQTVLNFNTLKVKNLIGGTDVESPKK